MRLPDVAKTRVILCRHGETAHNAEGRFLSVTDLDLNDEGTRQCFAAREGLAGESISAVFTSPFRRCVQTTQIIAPGLTARDDDRLREVHFGTFEGLTVSEIEQRYPGLLDERRRDPVSFRPPGGESFADASGRIANAAVEIVAQGGTVLVVSHRAALGILERILRGIQLNTKTVPSLDPGEFHVIETSRRLMSCPSQTRPSVSSNTSCQ